MKSLFNHEIKIYVVLDKWFVYTANAFSIYTKQESIEHYVFEEYDIRLTLF